MMGRVVWCVCSLSLLVTLVNAQCPAFDETRVPRCESKSDHQLCILAAHKDSDRLADFEFLDIPTGLQEADPLSCKLRTAAIRQHVMFYGNKKGYNTDCKRAAAVFKTNSLNNARLADVCEQIGFAKCGGCRHGGKALLTPDGSCKCQCIDAWGGRDCSECSILPVECLHYGNVTKSDTECRCACRYPWSGVHCEQCNRRCKHDGFLDPTNPRCTCQCAWPWTGIECDQCALQCKHNGRLIHNDKECKCECSPLASGPQCEQCTARCLNGGILDKKTCTCKCVGGFTGHQCEICDVSCKYNGTFIPNECRCRCNNPWTSGQQCEVCSNKCHGRGREVECSCVDCDGYWSGPACNNCTLQCVNEGMLDDKSCKCSCDKTRCKHGQFGDDCSCKCDGFWRGETCSQCHLNCRHGTLMKEQCACKCDSFWSGPKCDVCDRNCTQVGVLDTNHCVCHQCKSPYYGYDCAQKCTKQCKHGSVLNAEKCQCEQCVLPWLGPECNVCKLGVTLANGTSCTNPKPCGEHGTYDAENCRCICQEGWTGERCDKCSRVCAHGTLDSKTCSCSCDSHWLGVNCTTCGIECQNGGVVDKRNCVCQCGSMHSGTFCQGGPCHIQQSCDACLSVSDGCEWCLKTAQCAKKPLLNNPSSCSGPTKVGICPTYGECHMCEYTPAELLWLSRNGDTTLGATSHLSLMPEPIDVSDERAENEKANCDVDLGFSWCEAKQLCVQDWEDGVDGPCQRHTGTHTRTHALNGFISTDASTKD